MDPHRPPDKINTNIPACTLKPEGAINPDFIFQPGVQEKIAEIIRTESQDIYAQYLPDFLNSLSEFNRNVYKHCCLVPYAEKDWYRDPHDIYVTNAMQVIVLNQNRTAQAESRKKLPEWLVTAAIMHDRGYAVMTQSETISDTYLKNLGAYWENSETRILHSNLSREFADYALFTGDHPVIKADFSYDRNLFLEVIEKHDYALIGKYAEIPAPGLHHLDADSIFSISVMSFVKDYLSYAGDAAKLKKAADCGLLIDGKFRPHSLLLARAARYFSSEDQLPDSWQQTGLQFNPALAAFNETGVCIRPHSNTANVLTVLSFDDLVECCTVLNNLSSADDFRPWFAEKINMQFNRLALLSNRSNP